LDAYGASVNAVERSTKKRTVLDVLGVRRHVVEAAEDVGHDDAVGLVEMLRDCPSSTFSNRGAGARTSSECATKERSCQSRRCRS
jgi:hypothetical protein